MKERKKNLVQSNVSLFVPGIARNLFVNILIASFFHLDVHRKNTSNLIKREAFQGINDDEYTPESFDRSGNINIIDG